MTDPRGTPAEQAAGAILAIIIGLLLAALLLHGALS